jgi:hypothetical protein
VPAVLTEKITLNLKYLFFYQVTTKDVGSLEEAQKPQRVIL